MVVGARSKLKLGPHIFVVACEVKIFLIIWFGGWEIERYEAANHLVVVLTFLLLQSFKLSQLILIWFLELRSSIVIFVRAFPRLSKISIERAISLQSELPSLLDAITRGLCVTDFSENECRGRSLWLQPKRLLCVKEIYFHLGIGRGSDIILVQIWLPRIFSFSG